MQIVVLGRYPHARPDNGCHLAGLLTGGIPSLRAFRTFFEIYDEGNSKQCTVRPSRDRRLSAVPQRSEPGTESNVCVVHAWVFQGGMDMEPRLGGPYFSETSSDAMPSPKEPLVSLQTKNIASSSGVAIMLCTTFAGR